MLKKNRKINKNKIKRIKIKKNKNNLETYD